LAIYSVSGQMRPDDVWLLRGLKRPYDVWVDKLGGSLADEARVDQPGDVLADKTRRYKVAR